MSAMVRLILTASLLVLLTACGTFRLAPSKQLVQKAIALRLSQTQQQLNQQLKPAAPLSFEIGRLKITEKHPLVVENLPTYRIRGNYDFTMQLKKRRVTQQQNPFEVYLQRQQEGKTWRLLLPEAVGKDSTPIWRTYLIK